MKSRFLPGCLLSIGAVFLLFACTNDPKNNGGGSDSSDPSVPKLDVQRLELAMRDMGRDKKMQDTSNCWADYTNRVRPSRLMLASWMYGVDSVPENQMGFLDQDLYGMFCQFSRVKTYQQLIDSIAVYYPDNYDFNKLLAAPFARMGKAMPGFKTPAVRTMPFGYTRELQWDKQYQANAVYYKNNHLGLCLEYFASPKFPILHPEIPKYLRRRFRPDYLPVAVFDAIIDTLQKESLMRNLQVTPAGQFSKNPKFVDLLVKMGIKMYALDVVLPDTPDSVKIMYADSQMVWAQTFEARIYQEFIPYLYEESSLKFSKFIQEGASTSGLAKGSPPRLAQFIGWQIVRAYMKKNPDVTLKQLIETTDYRKIFEKSGYKPK